MRRASPFRVNANGGPPSSRRGALHRIYIIVTGIIDDMKKKNTEGSLYGQVQGGLAPAGIRLPNRFDLLSPQVGVEPHDTSAD